MLDMKFAKLAAAASMVALTACQHVFPSQQPETSAQDGIVVSEDKYVPPKPPEIKGVLADDFARAMEAVERAKTPEEADRILRSLLESNKVKESPVHENALEAPKLASGDEGPKAEENATAGTSGNLPSEEDLRKMSGLAEELEAAPRPPVETEPLPVPEGAAHSPDTKPLMKLPKPSETVSKKPETKRAASAPAKAAANQKSAKKKVSKPPSDGERPVPVRKPDAAPKLSVGVSPLMSVETGLSPAMR